MHHCMIPFPLFNHPHSVTLEILMSFEKQPLGISAVSWLDWTAGNFISTNGRNSHVKIWNASQKTSLRSIKIPYNSAITAITFNANNQKALIGFHDGTVAVYDIDRNRFDYKSQPGHTETIFSCKISPTSPDKFATASYDGTIKVWDLNHLSVTKTLYGNGEFVYCVDWSLTGRIIAGSFYSGLIMFWNPTTGRELLRLPQAHTKACYFLEWNHFHESILLSTSADNTVLVYDIHIDHLIDSEIQNIPLGSNHHVRGKSENGNNSLTTNSMNRNNIDQYAQVKYKFVHPAPVYGCSWNAFKPTVFCTAAHDGIVRVFNFAAKTLLARTLVGHSARAFSCLWSPLVPGLLASGSDDYSIMIWDVDVENFPESAVVTSPDGPGVFGDKVLSIGDLGRTPSMSMNIANAGYAKAMTLSALRVLQGHKSYVRALSWNYENKHLLFSGSWDSTIRIWNVITGSCLVEMNDHVADVYSLVSHPLRPFTYLSCSRDTTVRVWEVERIFRKMRYSALWEEGFQGVLNVEYSPEIDSPDLPQFLKSTLIHSHEGKSSSDFDGGRNSGGAKADLISLEETMKEFAKTPAPTIAAAGTLGLEGKRSQSLQEDIEGMQKRGNHYINSSEGKDSLELDVGRHSKSHRAKSVEELIFKACSYYQIFSFFTNGCGAMDLFEVALETLIPHLSDQPSRKGSNVQNNYKREIETMVTNLIRSKELRKVFAEQEIIPMAYSELNQQQMKKDMNVTTSSTITAKKEIENDLAYEQMIIFQHLKLQEYEKAIQLLLKNQQWDLAISIAPMVSMDYWKKLVADYGTFLLTSNNPTNSITSSTSTSTVMNLKSQRPPLGRAASAPNAGGNAGLSIFSSDERCIPYLLVSGNYDAAIQYYLAQQDYASAKLITQVMATKSNRTSGNENHQMLKEMTTKLIVNQYLSQGELILAAAELLSNQEADLAIELLFKAGEIDLAYCLSQCFSVNTSASLVATYDFYVENGESKSGNSRSVPPHLSPRGITKSILYPPATTLTSSSSNAVISSVLYLSKVDRNDCLLISWADQCAAYNAMDLAITMLQQQLSTVDLQEIEIALLLAKHSNETRCRKSIQQFNLKPLTAWSQLAKEQESIGSDEDAILYYLLARQYHKATQLAIPIMKKYLREPWEFFQLSTRLKPGALIKLYHLIKYIRVKEITDESLKFTFLSLLLWYSAHESWLLGLFENASAMFSVLLSNLHQNDASKGVNTGISREDVLFQLLFSYLYNQRLEEVTRLLKQLIEEMTQIRNQEMKDSLQRMLGFLTAENQKGCQYWTQFAVTFSSASSLSINNNNNGGGKLSNEGEELVHLIIR